jgi:large subunit ribosomal protein L24
MKILKGDRVVVLKGKDKGTEGEVLVVLPKDNKVIVEGVNVAKRHSKPNRGNQEGGIINKNMPIDASNVAPVGAKGRPARVGFEVRDGKKIRVDRKTGSEI